MTLVFAASASLNITLLVAEFLYFVPLLLLDLQSSQPVHLLSQELKTTFSTVYIRNNVNILRIKYVF